MREHGKNIFFRSRVHQVSVHCTHFVHWYFVWLCAHTFVSQYTTIQLENWVNTALYKSIDESRKFKFKLAVTILFHISRIVSLSSLYYSNHVNKNVPMWNFVKSVYLSVSDLTWLDSAMFIYSFIICFHIHRITLIRMQKKLLLGIKSINWHRKRDMAKMKLLLLYNERNR